MVGFVGSGMLHCCQQAIDAEGKLPLWSMTWLIVVCHMWYLAWSALMGDQDQTIPYAVRLPVATGATAAVATSRYTVYTRISGDRDDSKPLWRNTRRRRIPRCKLVVSRFVSVSKLRALCEYRGEDNTDDFRHTVYGVCSGAGANRLDPSRRRK